MHVATVASLAVGFLLPAFMIGSLSQFAIRWKFVICAALAGAVVFDLLTSLVVVKAEFLTGWYLKYPLLVTAFGAVLFMHAAVTGILARRVSAA